MEWKTLLEIIITTLFLAIVIYIITHNFSSELSDQGSKVKDALNFYSNCLRLRY